MNTIRFLIVTFLLLFLAACSDEGDGDGARTGTFIDSAVEGVLFTTATQSGTTDSAGTFTYLPGEAVSFYIGDILIGTAEGSALLTPLDFVPGAIDETDPEVTNILRFVQSLDADNDPDNGITISAAVATAALGLSLDFSPLNVNFESEADALLTILPGPLTTLIDAATAQAHFVGSLGGGPAVGSLTLSGADTGFTGTDFTPTTTVPPANTPIDSISWTQLVPGVSELGIAINLVDGEIVAVSFTWENLSSGGPPTYATYGISCPNNMGPIFLPGDCSQMDFDPIGQQVTFDATIELFDPIIIQNDATLPITVNGILGY